MDVIIDANILFAALIKESITSDLLFKNNLHLYAPEFIFEEFKKYKELIKKKTKRTEEEFYKLLDLFGRRINLIPKEETKQFIKAARIISPDKKDTAYFALALKLKCGLWSNDKKLKKQNIVMIYFTEDLINMFS